MQERYLGDCHDFLKYALLRHLNASLGVRLGINWYLTKPEAVDRPGNNDGEKRHHLKGGIWHATDPELLQGLRGFEDRARRTFTNVAAWDLLPPDTAYFDDEVSSVDRSSWHRRSLDALASTDLVFLDPDNGFEVQSMTRRTTPKYALFNEAQEHFAAGKAVVAIQFARQCDPLARAQTIRAELEERCGPVARLPVIRGRVAPNILFFTLAHTANESAISDALSAFAAKCGKVDLIA
ncbi:hypothetical protein [Novosphingobium sp.]|uniref:hypothetical protein n=1 Tax=Novosphingobium sp. TaxID=1874826 RepID=UPI001EB96259|nr:hypothetical protein [Novosphingobium sp.]MBK9011117.1 hypothetical protein [Novosphingobium sp.]